ncbi:MAG: hypothetical protein QXY52_06810 [Conexivisphaerales archaeon]
MKVDATPQINVAGVAIFRRCHFQKEYTFAKDAVCKRIGCKCSHKYAQKQDLPEFTLREIFANAFQQGTQAVSRN